MSQLPDRRPGPYDLLIANSTLVDGTASPARSASIAVRDDTIVAIGDLPRDPAARLIDATGLVLAPGFIDIHTHSDRTLLADHTADSKLRQGVTTEVIGNCGLSSAPCLGLVAEEERKHFGAWGLNVTWQSMGEYLDTLATHGVGINVVALVGHGVVRKAVMGYANRPPDAAELAAIRRHVADASSHGAFGMSFGGSYPPSSYAAVDELVEVAREVAAAGGIFATHMRSAGLKMLESVQESIRIGRESGASVQISHHGAAGRASWGRVRESLPLIEAANREGLNITVDQYPYTAGSGPITPLLSSAAQEGGPAALLARLRDPSQRAHLRDQVHLDVSPSNTLSPNPTPADVFVVFSPHNPTLEGRTLQEIADALHVDPRDVYLDLLLDSDLRALGGTHSMCEDDVRFVMRHPLMMVGSDSRSMKVGGKSAEGKPHPRTYGTFARILGRYVRDERVLTLEDAIAKMTGRPAAKLGLADRGTVEIGKKADFVLFSAERIRETSTFQDPHRYAEGVELVILNGRVVVDGDRHTGALAGRVLRAAEIRTTGYGVHESRVATTQR